jgi:hypothetical protein
MIVTPDTLDWSDFGFGVYAALGGSIGLVLFLTGLIATVMAIPARYDPAMRIKQWLDRK